MSKQPQKKINSGKDKADQKTLPPTKGTLPAGLYLVATPIGNLADMTYRAVETLAAADIVLCEDTRVTRKLLAHYDIHTPVGIYNDLSEDRGAAGVVDRIVAGAAVALVSDAGMPLISDPGYKLVRACRAAGVRVTSMPGANAVLTALQLSGLPTDAFLFLGFLPTKSAARRAALGDVAGVAATLVCYERADRVVDLLADVAHVMGPRSVAVARELTKLFEEVRSGPVADVIAGLNDNPIKGEVVVIIDRAGNQEAADGPLAQETRIRAALQARLDAGDTVRAAVDAVSGTLGLPRRQVYQIALTMGS